MVQGFRQDPVLPSRRAVLAGAATLVAVGARAQPQASAPAFDKPVVIELFTSQGCSSCPAADKVLGQIARQPNVIALSLPVDYWDYLGWKDTLASAGHTARQKAYSRTISGSHVYTPQAVLDGVAQVVGSDFDALAKTAARIHSKYGAMTVPLSVRDAGDALVVDVGAGGGSAMLNLIRVASHRNVEIGRGENSGKQLSYFNVGRGRVQLGEWNGEARRFDVSKAEVSGPDSDGWILLLQSGEPGKPGVILGAAKSANI